MKKKLVALLMSVISVFALLGFGSCDFLNNLPMGSNKPTEGVLYNAPTGASYAEVIGYEGQDKKIVIASTYNDLPVTTICEEAFLDKKEITSVIIPDSITSIGNKAFEGCEKLQYNVYGNSKYLGNENNKYVALISAASKNSSSYEIHSQTKAIADRAFEDCERMTEITIPSGITSIGHSTFTGCYNLASATISDSVTSIGDFAFAWCHNLRSITVPNSVTSIAGYAFAYCESLTSINIPDGITAIEDSTFTNCMALTRIVIPESVTSIGGFAFYHCENLTSITFKGTLAQWNAIQKETAWNSQVPATNVVCTDMLASL